MKLQQGLKGEWTGSVGHRQAAVGTIDRPQNLGCMLWVLCTCEEGMVGPGWHKGARQLSDQHTVDRTMICVSLQILRADIRS